MPQISKASQVAALANDIVSVKDFGAVGDGVTDDTAALQAAFTAVSNGQAVNMGNDTSLFNFTTLSIPSGITFIGEGILNGSVNTAKPSVASLRATDSAGRLSLLQTYCGSSISFVGSNPIKGSLTITNSLLTANVDKIDNRGTLKLQSCAMHDLGLKSYLVGSVVDAPHLIITDSPEDGAFIQRGGQIYMPFGYILHSTKRGAHVQLSGYLEIQDGEIHNSTDENLFTTGKAEVVAKRSVFSNGSSQGVSMIYGGSADMLDVVIQNNGAAGLVVESNSSVLAENALITGNGFASAVGDGVSTSYNGFVQVRNATITGNKGFAANALTGGMIQLDQATIDLTNNSGGIQVNANNNGYIIMNEPGVGNLSAISNTDCSPIYNVVGNSLAFIGSGENVGESTGSSFSKRQFAVRGTKTISSGSITVDTGWTKVFNEASSATDDLDNIIRDSNNPLDEVIIQPASSSQDVVIRHNTGNIRTFDGLNITLTSINKVAVALYNTDTGDWLVRPQ